MEHEIITSLIIEYRAGTLTDARARGRIGEISSLRELLEVLEGEVARGVAIADKELGNG